MSYGSYGYFMRLLGFVKKKKKKEMPRRAFPSDLLLGLNLNQKHELTDVKIQHLHWQLLAIPDFDRLAKCLLLHHQLL